MEPLSDKFLDGCRREHGRIIRGDNMTRIETFVDAAFAFAFTMLVISIDEIPRNPQELLEASKDIPAFVFSAMSIGSVWLAHSTWSRTFGLQDRVTVVLSLALVMLVLVFVYPIKLMFQTTVTYILVVQLEIEQMDTGLFEDSGWVGSDVVYLFLYVAVGLMALALIVISFYQNSLRYRDALRLNAHEIAYCMRISVAWTVAVLTAIVSCVLALTAGYDQMARAGFIYFTMFVTVPLSQHFFMRRYQAAQLTPDVAEDQAETAD